MIKRNKETHFCRLHPDFHIPGSAVVGEGFDGLAYVRRLKEHGVEALAFFLKCHYGHAYYDTAFPNRHPGLRKDMVEEVSRACRSEGVRFVAYYSVFLDSVAWDQHPDWRIQSTKEGVDAGFQSKNFKGLCVSSGYLEELMLPQCEEALEKYPIDELFFDTMTGFHPCYCDACREGFGEEIPGGEEDEDWLRYVRWYRGQYDRFFATTAERLRARYPEIDVIFNWNWGIRQPLTPPEKINRLGADLFATGRVASPVCRYFAGTGLPYSYMTGRFNYGLGDWNSARPATLLYTAATTIANGGSFYLIDRQLPDGSLEERSYRTMKEVFDFMGQRRSVLAGAPVWETGALFSYDSIFGKELERFPKMDERKQRMDRHEGVARLMVERGRHYTAFNEETLVAHLEELRLVILPEVEHLSDRAAEKLEAWVEGGGSVVATQPSGAPLDARLQRLAGIEAKGFREKGYGYFEAAEGERACVYTGFAKCDLIEGSGSEVRVAHIPPVGTAGDSGSFGHGYAPPSQESEGAALTMRQAGKGRVAYIAFPLFESFERLPNYHAGDLLIGLMDELLPDPLARLDTEAQVELVAARRDGDLIVHLVNHSGKENLLNRWYPRTSYVPEIRGLRLEISWPAAKGDPAPMGVPGGEALGFERSKGRLWVEIPELKYLYSVVMEGYFESGRA